jgi:uncharacterized coiled-coil protein SlyX
MDQDLAERLTSIESQFAHLERLCEQLNQVVLEQGRQLTKLTSQQSRITETVESIERERIKETNARPPHYQ